MSACQECGLPHQLGQRFCTGCGAQAPGAVAPPVSPPTPAEGTVDYRKPGGWAPPGAMTPAPPAPALHPLQARPAAPPPGPPSGPSAFAPSGGGGHRTALTVGLVLTVIAVLAVVALMVQVLVLADDEDEGTASGGDAGSAPGISSTDADAPTVDAVPAACPVDANTPEVRRYWQDTSGIHLVVVIHTTCASPQSLDDREARFGLFSGERPLITGTFDLAASPVAIPANGTSGEIELQFDGEATLDPQLRSRVYLPSSEASSLSGGFDVRYQFSCRPVGEDDRGAATAAVDSSAGADLGGAPIVRAEAPATLEPPAPSPDADADALAELERIHAQDAGRRRELTDQWVPQVSAKRLDAEATFDPLTGEILVHTPTVYLDRLRGWQARYPGRVVLLRGSDARSICGDARKPDCLALWIVAIAEPRASGDEVVDGWCEEQRLNYIDGTRIEDDEMLNCIGARYNDGAPSDNRVVR